jgi:hypothetical protein
MEKHQLFLNHKRMKHDTLALPCTMQRIHLNGLETQPYVKQYSQDGPHCSCQFDLSPSLECGTYLQHLQLRLRCENILAVVHLE